METQDHRSNWAGRPLAGRSRSSWRASAATASLLGLPITWLAVLFFAPVGMVALYSVGVLALFPGDEGFSLDGWARFFDDSIYLRLFWKSVRTALIVSAACVLLAYPVAYVIAQLGGRRKYILLLIIIVPFWTSYLLRVLAWKVMLGEHGVVNSFAFWAGLRDVGDPIPQLIYSQSAVVLVLTYTWFPLVVLPIFVSLVTLDRRLLEAAADLGASRWQAFVRVTLPLSLPGAIAGFAFVFIPTIGEFVTPALVGGPKGFLYGNAIADQFGPSFDWRSGAVLSLFLFGAILLLALAFSRVLQLRRLAALERVA